MCAGDGPGVRGPAMPFTNQATLGKGFRSSEPVSLFAKWGH